MALLVQISGRHRFRPREGAGISRLMGLTVRGRRELVEAVGWQAGVRMGRIDGTELIWTSEAGETPGAIEQRDRMKLSVVHYYLTLAKTLLLLNPNATG